MATTTTAGKTLTVESTVPSRIRSRSAPVEAGTTFDNVVSLDTYLRETLPVNLGTLAQDVVEQMMVEGQLEGVEVEYHLPEEAVLAELPRRQLEHVVAQLVSSAAQAMRAVASRPHLLKVIVEAADEFGDHGPRLRVQDTGAAVVVQDILQGVAERVESLGATLTVKSRLAGGNIFIVELPAESAGSSW